MNIGVHGTPPEDARRYWPPARCQRANSLKKWTLSQPTISRALSELVNDVVRIGLARSIQYALRDTFRGLPDIPV